MNRRYRMAWAGIALVAAVVAPLRLVEIKLAGEERTTKAAAIASYWEGH